MIRDLRMREQMSQDLHEELGAGLSALKLWSEMDLAEESDQRRRKLLEKRVAMADELITSLRQIIWALTSRSITLEQLVNYLAEFARLHATQHGLSIKMDWRTPNEEDPQKQAEAIEQLRQSGHTTMVVRRGGMVVFCGSTTGFNLGFDARYVWMRQKRIQGSHFAHQKQAAAANRLVIERRIDPCTSEVFAWDEIPRAHDLMWKNEHAPGNMAVLVGAPRRGLCSLADVLAVR